MDTIKDIGGFIKKIININKRLKFQEKTSIELKNRIEYLEKEFKVAINKADNNLVHCSQCGGNVKINYSIPQSKNGKMLYDYICDKCGFKGRIIK